MALDNEYFDSIYIDVVKKKYYNCNKVNAVFEDIRQQAAALLRENDELRAQLASASANKDEIGDAIISARYISQQLINDAKREADEIIAEAKREREKLISDTVNQQEYAVHRVEQCYNNMREHHLACIEAINAEWQDFLCGLFPESSAEELPEDLHARVGAIAKELFELDN